MIPIVGVVKTVGIQKANAVIPNVVHNQYGGVSQLLLELQVPLLPSWGVNRSRDIRETGRSEIHSKGQQGIRNLGVGPATGKAIVKGRGRLAPNVGRPVRARIEGRRARCRADANLNR